MGFHTFDAEKAAKLEDAAERYRYCSREELLEMLGLRGEETVADLGSGTGFYTDDVAPYAGTLYAVDVQGTMHDYYEGKRASAETTPNERAGGDATRESGVPENVSLVTADVADLPFDDGALDRAYSTMTFHEFASEGSLDELARVCAPGARLAVVDWSGAGEGETGPPVTERHDAETAAEMLEDAGFTVDYADERVETLAVLAER